MRPLIVAAGTVSLISISASVLLACRWSPITYFIGGDRALKLHKWFSVWTVLITSFHSIGMCALEPETALTWPKSPEKGKSNSNSKDEQHSAPPLPGLIAWLMYVVLTILSIPPVRRRFFEVFLYAHYLFIPAFVFSALHTPKSLLIFAPAALFYIPDRARRFWISWVQTSRIRSLDALPAGIVRVEFTKKGGDPFDKYSAWSARAGQYVFINIPRISPLQWHPFSISDIGADGKTFTLHIKDVGPGTFTHSLYSVARSYDKLNSPARLFVEGPYGTPSDNLTRYRTLIFIAGGIGITPLACTLQYLSRSNEPSHLNKVHLLWVIRDIQHLDSFAQLLGEVAQALPSMLEMQVYVTQTAGLMADSRGPVRLFKGKPSIQEYLTAVVAKQDHSSSTAVVVCGPQAMVDSTRSAVSVLKLTRKTIELRVSSFTF